MEKKTRSRRRVYADERRGWLDNHESGVSLSALAKRTGRNFRTIQKQVQQAAEERERSSARTELYRQAVTQHNDDLLGALTGLRESLWAPHDESLTVVAHFGPRASSAVTNGYLIFNDGGFRVPTLDSNEDAGRLVELAEEHLSRDKDLWKGIDEWRRKLKVYADECLALGQRAGDEVIARSGLTVAFTEDSARGVQEGVHEGFISWACRLAIETASGDRSPSDSLDLRTSDNHLRYGGTTLVTSSSPDELEAANDVFSDLVSTLGTDATVRKIVRLKRQLDEEAQKLKRLIGDILLLGLVPGRCSVCNRLGI